MRDIAFLPLAILLYGSGLLVWPACALAWRKERRTPALRIVFFLELVCLLTLGGFMCFSTGILQHGYYWLVLMILANILFTPFAIGAAIYDFSRGQTRTALTSQ
jgi:hypothetical protein